MAVDGYHGNQIRYLISLYDANLRGVMGKIEGREEKRLDEKTRSEKGGTPPGIERGVWPG